ncbi:hypothetical protein L8R85_24955 [Vibrio splendidus]|uniref:Uncharacterized protein n=1 Tax=Vibrio splendidus TaxID=29497 RepID=A0AA43G5E6_VIBSP|nr:MULTISPECIES: hypothetical protein [Vibrio]MDH5924255.1 hypothetical protein [Vibrio splendidus]MDH5935226.1 hypothetical protein [Vibrio splendidus]TCT94366.1 hypothetical protein EDB47_1523 [Vibrio crassostreae]CAK1942281.1 conserved hypothetical protein [Vibrio crassostreae]CAK2750174.1 conserved hypothetical protein [Vibrio crassostreae]
MPGFTPYLSRAEDLLNKARHDYERLIQKPSDSYAAFDFFVTIEHLPDWLARKSMRRENDILKLVSHIANGAKHFTLNKNRHDSLLGVQVKSDEYLDESKISGEHIIFEFQCEDGNFKGLEISAVYLAKLVLEFWEEYFRQQMSKSDSDLE